VDNEQLTMKKNVINFLSLFILLFSFFIFSGCENIFGPPKMGISYAAGTGYFSLMLDAPGRTIMPKTVQGDFAAYTLEFFEADTDTPAFSPVERTNANLSASVPLEAGTWDLYVTAYMDTDKTKPAAQGESKGIVIDTGETTTRSITLVPIADGNGEGTFSWDIDYPSNVTEATMTITSLPSGTEPVYTVVFTNEATLKTSSLTLNTGYYRAVFNLRNNEDLEAERWETLHIYQNMESAFTDYLRLLTPQDIEDFGPRAIISNTFNVENTNDWNNAVNSIASGGVDKNYVIDVTGDFSIAARTNNTFGNASGINVSLRGEGRTLSLTGNGNMLRIGSNQSMVLRDLTLRGHDSNDNSLVYMSGRTFTMNGGEISDNTATDNTATEGGGVYVAIGTFTMNGGVISGNESDSGGGVYMLDGNFTMNNGEISGNTTARSYAGGGVHVENGTFTMRNGKISDNVAGSIGGGVYVNGGTFIMNNGEISNNFSGFGGGVYTSGTFRIVTGIIYGSNEAEGFRNTVPNGGEGAALYYSFGTAQHGTYDGNGWNPIGDLDTTDGTIEVVNGVLQ
jgi:hypothetical protein